MTPTWTTWRAYRPRPPRQRDADGATRTRPTADTASTAPPTTGASIRQRPVASARVPRAQRPAPPARASGRQPQPDRDGQQEVSGLQARAQVAAGRQDDEVDADPGQADQRGEIGEIG